VYPTISPKLSVYDVGDLKHSMLNESHSFWLKCDGSIINADYYSELYFIIRDLFNYQNDHIFFENYYPKKSLFRLPDAQGRVIAMPGDYGDFGGTFGSERVNLTKDHLPEHYHFMAKEGVFLFLFF